MILSNNTNKEEADGAFLSIGSCAPSTFDPAHSFLARSLSNNKRALVSVVLVLAAERESMSGSAPLKLEHTMIGRDRCTCTCGYYRSHPLKLRKIPNSSFLCSVFVHIMCDYARMFADIHYAQYYVRIMYASLLSPSPSQVMMVSSLSGT